MTHLKRLTLMLLWALTMTAHAQDDSWQAALGNPREVLAQLREEIVTIPLRDATAAEKPFPLTGTLYQPADAGPHPVVVLNHGTPTSRRDMDKMGRYRLIPQITEIMRRGFAVLVPMRRGYGASPGDLADGTGSCERGPNYTRAGNESARDVLSALAYLRTRPTLDANRVVLMGQSAGGFASLATAAQAPPGVVAVINLAGGRGGNGKNGLPCAPDVMEATIAAYAKGSRVPVLWVYSENDKYFGPQTVRRWFKAFQEAGGQGRLVMNPPHGNDGHLLFYAAESVSLWSGLMDDFLRENAPTTLTQKP